MISYHHFLAMGIYTGWYHDETTDCAGLAQELDYLSQLYGLYTAVGTLSPSVLGAEHPQFDRKCLQENHVKNLEKPKTVLEWETAGFSGIQIPDHSISRPYYDRCINPLVIQRNCGTLPIYR
jgi:hypothetical protein